MLQNRIAICRAENKWTQQKLAEEVGVSRQTITAMENQKYNPSLILAFKVAKALEKPLTEVFDYKED